MHLLILNRYSDEFADYGRYIDHEEHTVSYVTVADHVPMIPERRGQVEVVGSLTDAADVLRAAGRCHRAAGSFDAVLAMSEFDLLTAAATREEFGVPGPDTHSTLRFRDKAVMKEAVTKAGLRVPRFEPVLSPADVAAFARRCPGAVVVKPRAGAASAGVTVIPAGAPLPREQDLFPSEGEYEAEEFLNGPIWHVDGIRYQGATTCRFASRYLGTCHGFALGRPLGSVLHRGEEAEAIADFADACLDALGLTDGAFHLEVIQHRDGPVFLEVGARIGGGEIPFVIHEVYGLDLFQEWVRVLLGASPSGSTASDSTEHVGFLMLPEPVGHTLVSRTGLVGRIPHLYAEELPSPGHRFDGSGGYEHILGRFRYRAASAPLIERAIEETLAAYHYELTGTR